MNGAAAGESIEWISEDGQARRADITHVSRAGPSITDQLALSAELLET